MSVLWQNGCPAIVREEWLLQISARLQRALCEESLKGTESQALAVAVTDLPPPESRVEELILGGLFLEMSVRAAGRTPQELLHRANALATAFEHRPVLSHAQRAADEISRNYRLPLRVGRLAEMLACEQTALRRQFQFEYGTDLRDYHVRARIQAAVRLICTDTMKIAAVAANVGYFTEKNLYRNIREITGYTPRGLKLLSAAQLRALDDRLLPQRRVP